MPGKGNFGSVCCKEGIERISKHLLSKGQILPSSPKLAECKEATVPATPVLQASLPGKDDE